LTSVLAAKQDKPELLPGPGGSKWQRVVKWCLFAFFFMILGHAILSLVPLPGIADFFRGLPRQFDWHAFLIMTLAGFLAQMVDGSMGLGYGTISTTFLLAYGVSPAIVSSRVHSARVFSSGVSGYSHHRFGNINKKLFRAIVVPGIIGAILGATLAYFGQQYANYVRVPVSIYTIYLGYYIFRKAFARRNPRDKVKGAGWLASAGGFMDAFAGGGWGTLVTSTLISKRKNPRYVVGSVCLAEFFVVLASSITFFILLRNLPLMDIAGMILGGVVAAPIAARLAGKLPVKTMFIAVGSLVIITSCNTRCGNRSNGCCIICNAHFGRLPAHSKLSLSSPDHSASLLGPAAPSRVLCSCHQQTAAPDIAVVCPAGDFKSSVGPDAADIFRRQKAAGPGIRQIDDIEQTFSLHHHIQRIVFPSHQRPHPGRAGETGHPPANRPAKAIPSFHIRHEWRVPPAALSDSHVIRCG
jgi:uncharacterized membrane protein YfcA